MTMWRGLHFIFALTLPLTVLLLVSCKQAHESRADLGPEFSPDALDKVLSKVVDSAHVENLHQGQMVHYEESLRVNNQDPDLLESVNEFSVIDRRDDPNTDTTRITYHQSSRTLTTDGNSWDTLEEEGTIALPFPYGPNASGLLLNVSPRFQALANQDQPPVVRITYHNMSVSEGDVDVPAKGKGRANCANVPNCKIHVTYLSYDEVLWSDDTHYTKKTYNFELSNGLPFMESHLYGLMTLGCVGMFQIIKDKNYYLRDCQYLTDLQM